MSLIKKALEDEKPQRVFMDPVEVTYREPTGDLWELSKQYPLLGKWHHYYEIYEELLTKYRGKSLKILEIGVYYGDSLNLWHDFFGPDATIVGMDIIRDCVKSEDTSKNIHVRIGDQQNHDDLAKIVDEFGKFDLIIDDGGHLTSQQYMAFVYLFRNGLTDDGLYIVEDLHTNLWPGYIDAKHSFLKTSHQLAELLYAAYSTTENPEDYFKGLASAETRTMEYYEAWVKSVQFFDSIVAIRRGLRPAPVTPDLRDELGRCQKDDSFRRRPGDQ